MRLNCSGLCLTLSLFLLVVAGPAARAQTDVGLSLYATFTPTTTYGFLGFEHQTSVEAAGGLFEFRHISNPFVGYEVTYSFNRANQVYTYTGTIPAGAEPSFSALSANAHEITGDWLLSAPVGRFRPFVLAGAGLLLTEPASGQGQTTSSTGPVYVFGAGLDCKLVPHLGLRFQYRANVYKAPNISADFGSNGGFTHTAEPMIGAYFRF